MDDTGELCSHVVRSADTTFVGRYSNFGGSIRIL